MPSPPMRGESHEKFMSRAVRMYMHEGMKQKQALAVAYSQWRKRKKKKK